LINPLLQIITAVAILGATYIFIVEPKPAYAAWLEK
jgi:hypothetical protein